MKLLHFLKNWALPVAMLCGVLAYFTYVNIPFLDSTHAMAGRLIALLQPLLIFGMLFLSFCKIKPTDLKPRRWHLWLILLQIGSFGLLSLFLILFPGCPARILIEGAMTCLICPTACAAAVVTAKLGGNSATLITYTILINLSVAITAPLLIPLVNPHPELSFLSSSWMIICKVFPMLICPLLTAWLIRYTLPKLNKKLQNTGDLAFYLWTVSLALAIAVSTKSIVESQSHVLYEVGIAFISLFCCILQFWLGKKIGKKYGERITAGQSLGQKNTVFAIWMGYTFFTPITAIAGGFYSVWHNIFNSYQLYRKRKEANLS